MSIQAPSRRQIVIAALAASGFALAGGGWWILRSRRGNWRGARGWIHPRDLDAAVRVGEAYLAQLPSIDGEALWRAIEERLAPWSEAGLGDPAFRRRVRAAVESDFSREAVVRLEGYYFDETTARLCALIALSSREAKPLPGAP